MSDLSHPVARHIYAREVLIEVGKQHAHNALFATMVQGLVRDVVQVKSRYENKRITAAHDADRGHKARVSHDRFHRQSISPDGSDQRMAEERILDTYRSVWNDFYAWETECASETIASLATGTPAQDAPKAEDSYFSQDIDILSYRALKRPIPGIRQPPRALPVVQAHPRYQACTPSNQNVMAKRPEYNPFVMPLFVPYADEARFQSKSFLEEFLQYNDYADPKLSWQSLPDPDCEWPHLDVYHSSALNVQSRDYTTSGIPKAPQTRIHCVSD